MSRKPDTPEPRAPRSLDVPASRGGRRGRVPMRVLAMETDATALRRAQAGDNDAFDALIAQHFPRVYSVLFRLVGNHEDAEDLAQECFVKAHGRLGSFRFRGSFQGWLVRIAVHLARDHHRHLGAGPGVDPRGLLEGLEDPLGALAVQRGPAKEAQQRELAQVLEQAIGRLPERLRVALVLRVLEGLPYEEVAQATGRRAATVRTQVMQARRRLLSVLEPWLEEDAREGGQR